ncbi:unnamed protein product [Symbiodinium sp. KB8]|nr:unnamed protein product [Symbiodinium sp. KB8]
MSSLRPPIYAVPFDPGEVFDPLGPTGTRLSPSQLGLAPPVLPPSSLPLRCMCKACRLSRESCDPSALQAAFQRLEFPNAGSGDVASAGRWKVVRRAGPRASFRRAILRIRCDIKELRSTSGLGQLAQQTISGGFEAPEAEPADCPAAACESCRLQKSALGINEEARPHRWRLALLASARGVACMAHPTGMICSYRYGPGA